VVISTVGTGHVKFDLVDFYHNETRLLGCDSGKLSVVESGRRLFTMAAYFESGAFLPLPISCCYGLDDAQDAYRAVGGGTQGRVVINP
jgi:NADPH:quinone reductase